MNRNPLLSPKAVGTALGVSEASIKRWCDQREMDFIRTAGGHRRISAREVIRYAKSRGISIQSPGLLGLPLFSGSGIPDVPTGRVFSDALLQGDESLLRDLFLGLLGEGISIVDLGDHLIAPCFYEIGRRWELSEVDIFQERRAVEVTCRALHEAFAVLPPADAKSPVALGGTLCGDYYSLPTLLVEGTLRQEGWKAFSLGCNLPASSFCKAVELHKPDLLWISCSHVESSERLDADLALIQAAVEQGGGKLVFGGRVLKVGGEKVDLPGRFCETLADLREIL